MGHFENTSFLRGRVEGEDTEVKNEIFFLLGCRYNHSGSSSVVNGKS